MSGSGNDGGGCGCGGLAAYDVDNVCNTDTTKPINYDTVYNIYLTIKYVFS